MNPPRVFVSYSYDGGPHEAWVLKLATDLRTQGIDAILDKWDVVPGQDLASFMEDGLARSDRVVLVCSDNYVTKADAGAGGVGYEKMIITRDLIASLSTDKFIPLLRNNSKRTTPVCLGTRKYIDFTDDSSYPVQLEDLLRTIHNAPRFAKPSIGPNPFAATGTPPAVSTPAVPSASPVPPPREVFSDPWFAAAQASGLHRVQQFGLATMEIAFGLSEPIQAKDQKVLLDAVRSAEIHTFGWPIGVVLSVNGKRPVPTRDGILAEVEHAGFSDTSQMDYWQLRTNGDFYLAQNLFEDRRDATAIFFNTQIVRVAEGVMFCRNLLENLQCKRGSRVAFRIRHSGIRQRKLASSNPNRIVGVVPRYATEDVIETPVRFTHAPTDDEIVSITQQLLAPMFMIFDFFELRQSVYDQIVKDFIAGKVT